MRILIATVTAGAGHLQAAAAVSEAWRRLRPRDVLEQVDLLDFVSKLQRAVYVKGYVKLVEHAPELWGMMFRRTDDSVLVRKLSRFRRTFAKTTNRRFVKHLRVFAPDAVICTHYLPLEVLGEVARGVEREATAAEADTTGKSAPRSGPSSAGSPLAPLLASSASIDQYSTGTKF